MHVLIINALGREMHFAVVSHDAQAWQIALSHDAEPIRSGSVRWRGKLRDGDYLRIENMPDGVMWTITKPADIAMRVQIGKSKNTDDRVLRFSPVASDAGPPPDGG
jgi:hypothetical protein